MKDIICKLEKKYLIIIAIVIGVFSILLLLYSTIFALLNMNNTKIYMGVKINNIDIGNLSKEEARNKVQKSIDEKISNNIKLIKDEFETELALQQLELKYNIEETIEQAYNIGKTKNIFKNNFEILSTKNKGRNIILNINMEEDILNNIIDEINGQIPGAMKESSYYIDESDLIITKGTEGNKINKLELVNMIKENISNIDLNENTIEIPVEKSLPDNINIEKIYEEIHTEAKDAYYTKEPFEIHPHIDGVDFAISMEEAKKMIEEEKSEYIIPLKITKPNITTDKLGTEAFPDLLASFTTKFDGGNVNRSTNLAIASRKINGTVVMPGDIFSYNATVGQRTIAAGYKDAAIYQNGKVVDGLAGGICQISSTLYNTALLANLEIISRRNHGFVTSYIAAGRDATVVYGATDFKFKNTRKYPIKIVASAKNGIARVDIYGAKEETEYKVDIQAAVTETIPYNITYIDDETLPEGKEIVEQKGTNGCKSVTYKVLYLNGAVVSKKLISSDTYNSMERVIRRGVAPTQENTVNNINEPEENNEIPMQSQVEEKKEVETNNEDETECTTNDKKETEETSQ